MSHGPGVGTIGLNAITSAQEAEQRQLEAPAAIERKGLLR